MSEYPKCRGFIVPVEGECRYVDLGGPLVSTLSQLQELVGGWIEPVTIPSFIPDAERGTGYVNEEGKIRGLPVNWRATDFMVPGVGLMPRDYIAGDFVLLGLDPRTGENADVPDSLVKRARLIESEAR